MQNRPVTSSTVSTSRTDTLLVCFVTFALEPKRNTCAKLGCLVLYHQPEKMAKSKEDLAERQENLEKLKRQHGIE